jgi:hypothetical protein
MKSDETQFAWLIENVRLTTYWDGRAPDTFTRDPNDAVRFSRQEDAERIVHWLMSKEPVVAREHGWFAAPADPQPEAPKFCRLCAQPTAPLHVCDDPTRTHNHPTTEKEGEPR